jgi:hypothetical protein
MIRLLAIIVLPVFLLCSCTTRKETASAAASPAEKPIIVTASDEKLKVAATEALGDREGAVIVIDPQTGRLRAVVNPRLAFEQAFPSRFGDKTVDSAHSDARGRSRPRYASPLPDAV